MDSFPGQPRHASTRKGKPFWILKKQEMTGWQWHQMDHMQIICTSLQTDNHTSITSLNFLLPSCRQSSSIKALKAINATLQLISLQLVTHNRCLNTNRLNVTITTVVLFKLGNIQAQQMLFTVSTCPTMQPLELLERKFLPSISGMPLPSSTSSVNRLNTLYRPSVIPGNQLSSTDK